MLPYDDHTARAVIPAVGDEADPEIVLASMVPESQPVPERPTELPPGAVQPLVGRLLGRGTRA